MNDKDTLEFAQSTVPYSSEGAELNNMISAGIKILVCPDPNLHKQSQQLFTTRLNLGRDPQGSEARLKINDTHLSRSHIRLAFDEERGRHEVVDLESTNGTYLNGVKTQRAPLALGDIIRIGGTVMIYTSLAAPQLQGESLIKGESSIIGHLQEECSKIAGLMSKGLHPPVLVTGETGVGKNYIAKELHRLTRRRGKLIEINCAGIPATLLESNLFGHVKGAFTGAHAHHRGYFEAARDGTLFFDEIGELPLSLQAAFLKVIDERLVMPVGSIKEIPVDVQIVCATNRNLQEEIAQGRFREDLYYRITKAPLTIAPLRERREDILFWLQWFNQHYQRSHHKDPTRIPPPALKSDVAEALLLAPYKGNIREVEKVITHLALTYSTTQAPTLKQLQRDPELHYLFAQVDGGVKTESLLEKQNKGALQKPPSREQLLQLLTQCDGNIYALAKSTGRTRQQLYRLCKKYQIDYHKFRKS